MVVKEINIQCFLYNKMYKDRPITVLVVGKNDAKRNALCHTIIKNMGDSELEQKTPSPFVFYDSDRLRLLAVRDVDENVLSKKCGYVVLMEDATQLEKIWKYTGCDQAVSKFDTFMTIFNNCAKDLEVMWIDAKSDTSVASKKIYWSAYSYDEPTRVQLTAGEKTYILPEKISHLNDSDDEEDENIAKTGDKRLEDGYCTIL
jgi:uncharacterized protein (DUF302 family)